MSKIPKIFCIGLSKTGTTTTDHVLRSHNVIPKGFDGEILKEYRFNGFSQRIKSIIDNYRAFQDLPWPLMYKECDIHYPNSKFILTVRSSGHKWVESITKQSYTTNPFYYSHKWAYGFHYPYYHKKDYLNFYETHNDNVRNHFAGRPEQFIEICWENGDEVEQLLSFLNIPLGDMRGTAPRLNTAESRVLKVSKKRQILNYLLSRVHFLETKNYRYVPGLFRTIVFKLFS